MASTVTPHTDMEPSPRVDVFIDDADLDGSTVTITVHQISVAGDVAVRNMREVASAGGVAATDYEVPLGVPVTYRVQQFDSGGVELGYVLELVTQVDIAEGFAVLSDPLVPATAVLVSAVSDFGGELRRTRRSRVYRAGYNTVALMGLQSLLEEVNLHCETDSLTDADALEDVIAAGQFLVRVMPPARLPLALHVVADSPTQKPIDVQFGGELVEWDISANEVTRSALDVVVAVINYELFADYVATIGGTYGDAAAVWSTYLDAIRNPPALP